MSDGSSLLESRELSRQLVLTLASAVRTASYYDVGNVIMRQAASALAELLDRCSRYTGSVSVAVHSHTVFVERARVPASVSTYERFSVLVELFERWNVGELTFYSGLREEELLKALMILARGVTSAGTALSDLLEAEGVERIVAKEAEPEDKKRRTRRRPLDRGPGSIPAPSVLAYSVAAQLGVDLASAAGPLEAGVARRVRHVTQALVDEILHDPGAMLALTTVKDFDRYLALHSVNVAVLSTVLGQRLGLDKTQLGELCLAGFLHDAGKLGVDPDVLQKPEALDPQEWEEVRRHPILAAYTLLSKQPLVGSNMRAVVVAFEHHLNYDLSGYPETELKRSVTLFGNIVAIADRFDALTTARVYRKVNFTPPEAIVYLLERAGTEFEPRLVCLFAQVLGVYPPGTVVVLTGGEVGIVCRPPAPGAPLDRPRVRVVTGPEAGSIRDLGERTAEGYPFSVVTVLNPSNRGQIPAVDPRLLETLAAQDSAA